MLKPYMTWNEVSFEEGKWRKIYGGDGRLHYDG